MRLDTHYLLENKRFTIYILNYRINSFAHGPTGNSNNQPPITKHHIRNKFLHYSASQMLCFMRYFSMMIGDLMDVEVDEEILHSRSLREMLDVVYAPYVNSGTAGVC